ncbi:hypothetical protein DWW10_23975 [Bacteroides intestinalis]|uniref:Uncharacterized protein n=1 Tax=Bacteroides intestinalis TaxID=329854 RepID=A0A412XR20_9BACE|nr:hypothetical protein DWW10_23975 [Bacteroides intestinalis]
MLIENILITLFLSAKLNGWQYIHISNPAINMTKMNILKKHTFLAIMSIHNIHLYDEPHSVYD